MASPTSVAPLFSDLRGVTVRNTFLEFEDIGADNFPESGFARQASEPAKPFNRQVSDQTTAGSGATPEESATEPEEGYLQLASYLNSTLPQAASDRCGGGRQLLPGVERKAGAGMAPMAPKGQMAVMRFCPNCGAEAEPSHRFCPYCCYPLQPSADAPPDAGGGVARPPPAAEPAAAAGPSPPDMLACLRRFRYVEARPADVELARVLCLNFLQAGRAT